MLRGSGLPPAQQCGGACLMKMSQNCHAALTCYGVIWRINYSMIGTKLMFDFFDFGDAAGGGLFDGLADMLFGHMEGGGFFETILGDTGAFGDMFGGAFERGSLGEMLGGMGRAARTESSLFEVFGFATDRAFDYVIWRDVFDNKGSFKDFKAAGFGGASKQTLEEIRETIQGHGFILQQLRFHKDEPGVEAILGEYEALGGHLPSEDLAKQAHRMLAKFIHPDKNAASEELMKRLNQAKDALTNPQSRDAYARAMQKNPKMVNEWLNKFGNVEWEAQFESMASKARLRLSGPPAKELEGTSKWFAELGKHQQGGIIFAGLLVAGVGTYMLAKAAEKKSLKPEPREPQWRSHVKQETPPLSVMAR